MNEPIGDLCVLHDDNLNGWTVSLCRGTGTRQTIKKFATQTEAIEFAMQERDRRRATGEDLTVHFPDDCPCSCRTRL